MEIRVTLSNGEKYTLGYPVDEAQTLFARLVAEPLENVHRNGWIPVNADSRGTSNAYIRGSEIIAMELVDPDEAAPHFAAS